MNLYIPLIAAVLAAAIVPAVRAAEPAAPMRIVLVGDSTVEDGSGWGAGFKARLGAGVECVNRATGGRSSKSYRDEGRWEKAMALKPDYVLIQFGHNDQPGKGPERETDPNTTYSDNLRRYIDEARAQGAKPILLTSLVRRSRDAQGNYVPSSLQPYADAAARVAAEKKVPLIDLHRISGEHLRKMTRAEVDAIEPPSKDGKRDATHLNAAGSIVFGNLVADELARVVPELARFITPATAATPK